MPESPIQIAAREFLNSNPEMMPNNVRSYAETSFVKKADQDEFFQLYFEMKRRRAKFTSDVDRWKN